MTEMIGPALAVSGVSFSYPDGTAVLDDVSLTIDRGERVALLGPNGAGKTTFALHLNAILECQSGSIAVGGLMLDDGTVGEVRRRVGMVFHDANDQLFMPTVRDDVAFGPANLGFDPALRDRRVAEALEAVGANHLADRPPHHLSAGEKRRVAVATVLAMDPEILVLDEPTAALDPAGRRELASLLASLPHAQIVITHDLPFALEFCPRSVLMSGGRIVADDPTADLLANSELLAAHRLEMPYQFDRQAW